MNLLTAEDIAGRLSIPVRSAKLLMQQMPHIVISGKERKRIRVSESQFASWLARKSTGKPVHEIGTTGSKRKLARREA
jgi:hypothetical protein